ncbi:endoplasmic reticulum-based factor for assembly of V-ATPase-domain-containing protein [Corynascus novoguineensis]|uniref:Endoplasmic reticulum-based factor for assembly of V-ATPase-domain-containing protein n=1 Tax=Corynascus novoguineensis TaxID=1126955 RepID=A0AAN7CY74_9PEZI|nr:endoplasmic reticulum-based factor for assembly of V-ATPase-domain-containing protein [Corynascus novoguineensis]
MTPRIVAGLQSLSEAAPGSLLQHDGKPSLGEPAVGNPISHSQVVDLWKALRKAGHGEYTLEMLLKGSKVYVPPPPSKPEPSDEYKALMARLRREQDQREYERMTNPLPPMETFSQRYPNGTSIVQSFAAVNRPSSVADIGDDEVTYNDVHRQLMLILNFVASILGVAATLWIVARWWSTPARLFLTMGGSLLVGIAEVAVYSGYVWHLGQAKKKDKTLKEVKEVLQTWTVGAETQAAMAGGKAQDDEKPFRRRQKDMKN